MTVQIQGRDVDDAGRCAHHRTQLDIANFRFPCCDGFWACRACHDEAHPDHLVQVWGPDDLHRRAVLCGACRTRLSLRRYAADPSRCPKCAVPWNPNCVYHHPLYFQS